MLAMMNIDRFSHMFNPFEMYHVATSVDCRDNSIEITFQLLWVKATEALAFEVTDGNCI